MAIITSYSTLQTAVADYLARDDLTTFVPNFIQAWEVDFYREPKNFGRWMEVALDDTIASDVIAVPADYLGLKFSYVSGAPSSRLDRVSMNQMHGRYPRGIAPDLPVWITREASNFIFGPPPDADYTIHLVYWGKPTAIRDAATDASSHFLITDCPDLCLFGSLMQAVPFIKDDSRIPIWTGMLNQALASYRRLMRDEESSGSPSQEVLA